MTMTTTVPVEIRSRGGDVLFAAEVDASIGEPSRRLKAAVEMAVKGGANLDGAHLDGAYLGGANLDGAETLTGSRPILQVGPIGSASRWLVAYVTTAGLRLRAGCFFGTREEFVARLADTHGDNIHAQEYLAALALIDVHAALWAPKECGAAEEAAA